MRESGGTSLVRLTPSMVLLLLVSAGAWLWTVLQVRDMGGMAGTMGLGPSAFAVMWALMMTAMMLPSAAPFAATYGRTFYSRRHQRMLAFAGGYLVVWGLSAVPAFAIAWVAGEAVARSEATAIAFAATIFATCGVYQLTSLKYRCLSHCRPPLGHLFHVASYKGPFRDLRVGIEHGFYCLACCWSLMLLMAAFGLMNLTAMIALAAAVGVEKLWSRGAGFSRAVGVVSLALAVAVLFVPELAPGLTKEAMEAGAGAMSGM